MDAGYAVDPDLAGLGNADTIAWLQSIGALARASALEDQADAVADAVAPGGPPTGADAIREGTRGPDRMAMPTDLAAQIGPGAAGLTLRGDARADQIARDHGALAVTRDRDVHFRAGFLQPHTTAGRWLMAHEGMHGEHVTSGLAGRGQALAREPDPTDRLAEAPAHIVAFLAEVLPAPVNAADGATLAVARRLTPLSGVELAEFRDRYAPFRDLAALHAALTPWLAELQHRQAASQAHESVVTELYGMDELYDRYRSLLGMLSVMFPRWVHQAEAVPAEQLDPQLRDRGTGGALYFDLRQSLAQHGWANVTAFQETTEDYIATFSENARAIAYEHMGRYEALLRQERERYADPAVVEALRTALAPAGAQFREADRQRSIARANQPTPRRDLGDPAAVIAATRAAEAATEQGQALAEPTFDTNPLVGNEDFPLADLAKASSSDDAQRTLDRYIRQRLDDIADTRSNLQRNREMVFELDVLVAETLASKGLGADSLPARIVTDHTAPTISDAIKTVALVVLSIVLAFATGGGGLLGLLAAGASLGLSATLAAEEYARYARRSDAYGAQLLSEEPSLTWVVVSMIAAGLDLAIISATIRPIRPALRAFEETGDLIALERQLQGLQAEVRTSVLRAAQARRQAKAAWQALGPRATMVRGSAFGLDLIAQATYALYNSMRAGVRSFQAWSKTDEFVQLFGQVRALSPEDLTRVKALHESALADLHRIDIHGRSIGMTDDQISEAVRAWAQRGTGTADDVISGMASSRSTAAVSGTGPVDPGGRGLWALDEGVLSSMSTADAQRLRTLQGRMPASPDELEELVRLRQSAVGAELPARAGTPEHMLASWRRYAPRNPRQTFERWVAGHPSRMRNSLRGPVREDAYRSALADVGLEAPGDTLQVAGQGRQVDLVVPPTGSQPRTLVQVKAGKESLTLPPRRSGGASRGRESLSNADALRLDQQLVRGGDRVVWAFEELPSGPLVREALDRDVVVFVRVGDAGDELRMMERLTSSRGGMTERQVQAAIDGGQLNFVQGSLDTFVQRVVAWLGG